MTNKFALRTVIVKTFPSIFRYQFGLFYSISSFLYCLTLHLSNFFLNSGSWLFINSLKMQFLPEIRSLNGCDTLLESVSLVCQLIASTNISMSESNVQSLACLLGQTVQKVSLPAVGFEWLGNTAFSRIGFCIKFPCFSVPHD